MKLTVLTWNVLADAYARPERYPLSTAADLAPGPRRARIVDHLRATDADVLCLQEVEPDLFDAVTAALPDHRGWYGPKPGKPDGSAVWVRADRPATHHEVLPFRAIEPGYPHVAVLVQIAVGDQRIGVASAHLRWQPPSTPPERHLGRLQLGELLDRVAELGGPWIVCGDLNATWDSPVLALARERGFDEGARSLRPWDTVNIDRRRRKLDYVLFPTGAWTPHPDPLPALAPDTPMPSPVYPSDHLPIRVTFQSAGVG